MLLTSTLENHRRPHRPLVVIQSCTAQSALPILRSHAAAETHLAIVFCLLYPPTTLSGSTDTVRIHDFTARVPGFADEKEDLYDEITRAVKDAPSGPLSVYIDSVDTLADDLGSDSRTLKLIHSIFTLIRSRPVPSRLVLHIDSSVAPTLAPQLVQTRLSPSLAHVTARPTALIKHVALTYLTPPPPVTPPERFWRVFGPIAARPAEAERLVFGPDGTGNPGSKEMVVEVIVRGGGDVPGTGSRTRGAERELEGWTESGPCELSQLPTLKDVFTRKIVSNEKAPDPTQNVSFNLNLTPEQQRQRASVPLPYAHEGKSIETPSTAPAGVIYYDPDSADDIDDDDPDEDLDI